MKPPAFRSFLPLACLLIFSACTSGDQKAFERQLAVKADTLQIDNTKDTLILGSKGTALFFEKESFVLPDGSAPKGPVSIQLKECYGYADMIRENLGTTANEKLLETRGMLQVTAFADGQELELKKGKKFIVHFPKDSADRKKPMNLFYGRAGQNKTIDWELDSATLIKPTARLTGWGTTGYPDGDTTTGIGFYFSDKKERAIDDYFYKHFDNTRLQSIKDLTGKEFMASFTVTRQGKISNVKVEEWTYDSTGKSMQGKTRPDPYFYEFIRQMPVLKPFYADRKPESEIIDSECSLWIGVFDSPPDYRNNEGYNRQFNQKYAVFRNAAIQSMNDVELNYYIFSATRLGWINCDFFWETPDEKINYIVKADPTGKPNIQLIFKQAKSIMAGTLQGDQYVFRNVPANQDIKIVALSFNGSKPSLAVAETKTGKQVFENLAYKDFSITELERQLALP